MEPKSLKYILDMESFIGELEEILKRLDNNFSNFQNDFIARRAVERNLEIIGEAVNQFQKLEPSILIENSSAIITLRNLIAHGYDSVDHEILWGILIRHIPKLKQQIAKIKKG